MIQNTSTVEPPLSSLWLTVHLNAVKHVTEALAVDVNGIHQCLVEESDLSLEFNVSCKQEEHTNTSEMVVAGCSTRGTFNTCQRTFVMRNSPGYLRKISFVIFWTLSLVSTGASRRRMPRNTRSSVCTYSPVYRHFLCVMAIDRYTLYGICVLTSSSDF